MNRNKRLMLQMFTDGENQNQNIRTYNKKLLAILQSVFKAKSYWSDFFTDLQALDGITHKSVAFTIKTNDVAAAVTSGSLESGGTPAYNTGANVAFGTGTESTNRFGNRTEVKYTDTDVEYSWDWVYHEGIDKHTVNADFDAAHAVELEKISAGITGKFNTHQGKYLSDNAGKTINVSVASLNAITSSEAIDIFNQIDAYMTDIEVDETLTRVAAVPPVLYNAIVDNSLSTTAKGSSVNIDRNEVRMFKDFVIRKLPSGAFQSGEICIAGVARMGVPFTGIETARAFEAHDFDGTTLQGAGKAGQYISEDNLKALVKVTATATGA